MKSKEQHPELKPLKNRIRRAGKVAVDAALSALLTVTRTSHETPSFRTHTEKLSNRAGSAEEDAKT